MEQKTCFFCKNTYNEDEMRKFATFNGFEFSCKECARSCLYKCSSCKISYCEYDFEKYHINNKIVCSFCEREYFQCSHCHKEKPNTKMAGNLICSDCFNKDNNDNGKIHDYLFKPKPIFHKNKSEKTNLFIGIELEINPCIDNYDNINFVKDISNQNNFIYCKSDGSLDWDGVEIVSHPATLRYHIESNNWDVLLKNAKKYNLKSDELDKCGVHVHISRSALSNKECAMLDYFVNKKKDFWKKIARRESHYSAYIDKELGSWGRQVTDRHCAVNLSNDYTVEIRIFKGTLQVDFLKSYIEVCDALVQFIKTYDNNLLNFESNQNLDNDFINYFMNSTSYVNLKKYFKNNCK